MTKTEKAKLIKQLIKSIRKDYITRCEKPEDREWGCIECLACGTVEFLERHIKLIDVL